jgi:flagellar M-ring protein FliF
MRTEPPSPMASALARLRSAAGRLRRWLAARGTGTRIALLLAGLAALGTTGYLASGVDQGEPAYAWIYEHRKLSGDDVARISEALDLVGIGHVADPNGRVGVKPSQKREALAQLAKAKVVPPSLDDLSGEADAGNPLLELPGDRERHETLRLERILKFQIERLDAPISSATVQIHRVKKRSGPSNAADISASVYLETEAGRTIGHRAAESIQRLLTKDVPGLKPDAITVMDSTGRAYINPDDPSLKEQIHQHAREEDWQVQVFEELRHIPGVGVTVQLEDVPAPPPAPEPPPAVAFESVSPNGQVRLVEPPPSPAVSPLTPQPTRTRANVWVRVPRSFYLLDFQTRQPGRQPTQDEIDLMKATTEKFIREAVAMHIPRNDLGVVKVAVVQDDLTSTRPIVVSSGAEAARPWAYPALAGVGSAAGLLAVAGLVRLATRRPAGRPSRTAWRPGFVADGPAGPVPGPSERVRELIRLNPEAAAGVLQRWIGQGEAPR